MFEDDDDYDLGGVRWQASQAPNPALRKLISDSNNAVLNSPPILTPNSRNSEPYFPDSSSSYTRPTTGASTSTSTAKARRRAKATHPPAQSTSVASVLDLPSVDLINMFKGVSRKADENMHAKAQAQQAYAGAATHRVGLKQRSTLAMGSVGRPRPASVVGSIKGKERDYDREPLQARRVSMSAMVSPTDPTTSTGNKKTKRSPLSRSVSSSGSGSSPGASFFAPESRNTTPDTPFGLAESHSMEMDIDTPRFSSDDADLMPPPPLPRV
ncbi:hypothetical protein MKEN_00531200 [Mycena kentingensis (nom. inval.)]|nr:hypothetical protein MKEN_00531200 [Mycena kentingensis (nom. inval.)]